MEAAKQLHAHLIVSGFHRNPFHISKVLISYAVSEPHLSEAILVFKEVDNPNTFIYNTMLRAFAQSRNPIDAILLYGRAKAEGLKQDHMTFPFIFKACARIPAAREGQWIHTHAVKLGFISDLFISNALIHLYCSFEEIDFAQKVFDEMPIRDFVSWNSLICGCWQKHRFADVLCYFNSMRAAQVKADKVTMVSVVSACSQLGEWELAESMIKFIKENSIEVDVYLGNTLIDYYGRRGLVESAQRVFDKMPQRNTMSMNAMVAAYAKAGNLPAARKIFDSIPQKDLVSWSSMITGYSQAGQFSQALVLFRQMQQAKFKPDKIVIVDVLSACAHIGYLHLGRSIHCFIHRYQITRDIYVGNSLIFMYSKCGCIKEACQVFDGMIEKDTVTWNSIIMGLATSVDANAALLVFSNMLNRRFKPDDVTFIGVLTACVHSGLVEKGLKLFRSMRRVHGLEPQMKHYGCVVDLLARAGEVEKAFEFIQQLPMSTDPVVWRTLLGACKVHGDVALAEDAS
ncbi:Pentatricopeptide repeat-containing protein [Apostasia shenzhenica]|uniref:Pentatricopeptide repeat-containing protein n=1 Tax=Apostasia shenzhenica TaxID=1088818 RepID=A0A2I0AXQ6_9ASPA|nr:Pentatricopeptide repeat-containing protein [Apostasia shenzhenica]